MAAYDQFGSVQLTNGSPVPLAVFDPSEELHWCAAEDGMVHSHVLPTFEPYSTFALDKDHTPAIGIFPNAYGLIALTHDCLHFFGKGGLRQAELRCDELLGVTCGCLAQVGSGSLLAAATALETPTLSLVDITSGQVTSQLVLDAPASIARFEPRSSLICLAGDDRIRLFDVRRWVATSNQPAREAGTPDTGDAAHPT